MKRALNMKRALIAGFLLFGVVTAVAAYSVVWPKLLDLRYRLQLIEARQTALGGVTSNELVKYQAGRGDAAIQIDGISPFKGGKWRSIGYNWEEFEKTKALGVYKGDLYVGLRGRNAAIWHYNGKTWRKAGSWPDLTYVQALMPHDGTLVAGINDRVFSYDGLSWTDLAFPSDDNAYSIASLNGTLFVGLTGSIPRVFAYNGGWIEISKGLPSFGFSGVYELHVHSDKKLYAGLISTSGATSVFRFDDNKWTQIGGQGLNGSWLSNGATYALSFASFQGQLIVALNRHPMASALFSPIWAFDGQEWHPVGATSVPVKWGEMDNYNALLAWRDRLVVGAGGAPTGNASAWEYGRRVWRQVGGHGINGSWGHGTLSGNRNASREYIYRLIEWRGQIIAGFGDAPGAAQVWAFAND